VYWRGSSALISNNGDCPGELVNLFWIPAYFWRLNETHCLNLAIFNFVFFFPQDMANFLLKFSKIPLLDSPAPFCFWSRGGENSPQKKPLIVNK
jgi:hypothetical protein